MANSKKLFLFISLIIVFLIILFALSPKMVCGCDCMVPAWGIKSYLTGKYYPKIFFDMPKDSAPCWCACSQIVRFPIEVIIAEIIILLILWRFWLVAKKDQKDEEKTR